MRISDWSSDVCSSVYQERRHQEAAAHAEQPGEEPDRPGHGEHDLQIDRHLGDGQVDLHRTDRKSVVEGKSVSVRVVLGGHRNMTKTTVPNMQYTAQSK